MNAEQAIDIVIPGLSEGENWNVYVECVRAAREEGITGHIQPMVSDIEAAAQSLGYHDELIRAAGFGFGNFRRA